MRIHYRGLFSVFYLICKYLLGLTIASVLRASLGAKDEVEIFFDNIKANAYVCF